MSPRPHSPPGRHPVGIGRRRSPLSCRGGPLWLAGVAGTLSALSPPPNPAAAQDGAAPGQVLFQASDGKPEHDFAIALSDPAKVAQARETVAGRRRLRIAGTVVKRAAPIADPRSGERPR